MKELTPIPIFTRRHHELVARILHDETLRVLVNLSTVDDIFDKFARVFEADNTRFDYAKFHKAVWEDKGEVK